MRAPVILANAGVPMLMLAFPAAFFLLIPVVAIEWWIARPLAGVTPTAKIVGVAFANAISMLAGWPLMWIALGRTADQVGPARTFLARFAHPKDSFCDLGGRMAGSVF